MSLSIVLHVLWLEPSGWWVNTAPGPANRSLYYLSVALFNPLSVWPLTALINAWIPFSCSSSAPAVGFPRCLLLFVPDAVVVVGFVVVVVVVLESSPFKLDFACV